MTESGQQQQQQQHITQQTGIHCESSATANPIKSCSAKFQPDLTTHATGQHVSYLQLKVMKLMFACHHLSDPMV